MPIWNRKRIEPRPGPKAGKTWSRLKAGFLIGALALGGGVQARNYRVYSEATKLPELTSSQQAKTIISEYCGNNERANSFLKSVAGEVRLYNSAIRQARSSDAKLDAYGRFVHNVSEAASAHAIPSSAAEERDAKTFFWTVPAFSEASEAFAGAIRNPRAFKLSSLVLKGHFNNLLPDGLRAPQLPNK